MVERPPLILPGHTKFRVVQLTPEQERIRAGWKFRAVTATQANQTPLGCMVLRVTNHPVSKPPRFSLRNHSAAILPNGQVVADFQDRDGLGFRATLIGHVHDIRDQFRFLADHLKLSDAERLEMFAELRKWLSRDLRSTSDLSTFDIRKLNKRT